MLINCRNCNVLFETFPSRIKAGKGVFCSKKCWQSYHCLVLICRNCGKEYLYPKSQTRINFCSKSCMGEYRAKLRVEVVCGYCKKNFTTYKDRLNAKRGKYCSTKCYWLSMKLPEETLKDNRRNYTRSYRRNNRDKTAVWKHTRRALSKNAGGYFTEETWLELKSRYNQKCSICGKRKKLTVDHVIPLKKWSSWIKSNEVSYQWNDIENIQPLCSNCNSQKSWLIK